MNTLFKHYFFKAALSIFIICSLSFISHAQNVGINLSGATPSQNAILDLNTGNSGNLGIIFPAVTLGASLATFSPPIRHVNGAGDVGMMVFNSVATNQPIGYYYWTGSVWVCVSGGSSGNAWQITGNSNIVDGVNFLGTTNDVPLTFITSNASSGRIDPILFNTFFGYQAGDSTTNTGENNTAMGYQSLQNNTTGDGNTATGIWALQANTDGVGNTANGGGALWYNTSGNANTAMGIFALENNTFGGSNTAVGSAALVSNNTSSSNTAIGYEAGYNNAGSWNTFIGDSAGYNATSNYNTFVGYESGVNNTGGDNNTAIGIASLFNNSGGGDNTAIGANALYSDVNGTGNSAVGSAALQNNTNGNYSIAMGFTALTANQTGTNNTALGAFALTTNNAGSSNAALGYSAGYNNLASKNVFIGDSAGYVNTTGSNNTFVGYRAHAVSNNLTNVTAIGNGAKVGTSNSLVLGNAANVGIGTPNPVNTVDDSGSMGTNISAVTTGTVTVGASNSTILASPGTTVTLPNPGSTNIRRIYSIVYNGTPNTGTVTIQPTSGSSILDYNAALATFTLNAGMVQLQSNGTNWYVISPQPQSKIDFAVQFGYPSGINLGCTNGKFYFMDGPGGIGDAANSANNAGASAWATSAAVWSSASAANPPTNISGTFPTNQLAAQSANFIANTSGTFSKLTAWVYSSNGASVPVNILVIKYTPTNNGVTSNIVTSLAVIGQTGGTSLSPVTTSSSSKVLLQVVATPTSTPTYAAGDIIIVFFENAGSASENFYVTGECELLSNTQ